MLDTLFTCVDEDLVYWNPTRLETKGRENFRKLVQIADRAIPDERWMIKRTLVQGDVAAFEGVDSGTFTGVLESPKGQIQPTNKKYAVPFTAVWQMSGEGNGLISEWRSYWDALSFYQQLGILSGR
jgi:ketosteroid isomerase-like protein